MELPQIQTIFAYTPYNASTNTLSKTIVFLLTVLRVNDGVDEIANNPTFRIGSKPVERVFETKDKLMND